MLRYASKRSEQIQGPIFTASVIEKVYNQAGHGCALRRWLIYQFIRWHCCGDIGGLDGAMRGKIEPNFFRDVIRTMTILLNGKQNQVGELKLFSRLIANGFTEKAPRGPRDVHGHSE